MAPDDNLFKQEEDKDSNQNAERIDIVGA